MAEGAKALGLPLSVEFEGRAVKFAPMDTLEVLSLFETYLEQEQWKAVQRARPYLPADDYKEQMAGVRRDAAAGVFNYGSEYWRQSLMSPHHQKHLLWLMATFYPEQRATVDKEFIDRLCKDMDKLQELFVQAGYLDPNSPAPSAPAATT